ncbi:MAG: hypothetical protein V4681_02495 [Patescibacteria group bacterium]
MFRTLERPRDRFVAHLLNMTCSWAGSGDKYVAHFQKNLEALAGDLSQATGLWLRVRYNNLLSCAEIFSPCDRTVALVAVHGEMCLPTTAHVISPLVPSEEFRELFQKHLRIPTEGEAPRLGMDVRFHGFA